MEIGTVIISEWIKGKVVNSNVLGYKIVRHNTNVYGMKLKYKKQKYLVCY